MQAIQTHVIPATNHKPTRIKARCDAGSLTMSYDYAQNMEDFHRTVARALAKRLDWSGELVSGCLPDGTYAHVFTGK